MNKKIAALGICAALSTLPVSAFAHGYNAGDAALGGLVGGVVGGLIGSAIVPYPVYAAPVVVERYAPAPVIVERYERPVVVYRGGHRRGHGHKKWHKHGRHWDDD